MKITLCGSIKFYGEMLKVKSQLEEMGHQVKLPPSKIKNKEGDLITVKEYYQLRQDTTNADSWIWERKKEAIMEHFKKINWGDAILVTNYDKRGIKNYVGSNTLIEMGLALWLEKQIYLLNPIPGMSCKEEILGMQPTIINEDLTKIPHGVGRAG